MVGGSVFLIRRRLKPTFFRLFVLPGRQPCYGAVSLCFACVSLFFCSVLLCGCVYACVCLLGACVSGVCRVSCVLCCATTTTTIHLVSVGHPSPCGGAPRSLSLINQHTTWNTNWPRTQTPRSFVRSWLLACLLVLCVVSVRCSAFFLLKLTMDGLASRLSVFGKDRQL